MSRGNHAGSTTHFRRRVNRVLPGMSWQKHNIIIEFPVFPEATWPTMGPFFCLLTPTKRNLIALCRNVWKLYCLKQQFRYPWRRPTKQMSHYSDIFVITETQTVNVYIWIGNTSTQMPLKQTQVKLHIKHNRLHLSTTRGTLEWLHSFSRIFA